MKKMQCEVCGSTEIKKVSDGIFECQSCGVQYDATEVKKLLVEVTGKVKIDHSEEVENTLKRAEQYEEAGNDTKAAEYYNAALDMDADNKVAQKRVKEIADQRELEDYYIIEPDVDPKENVRQFLEQLAATQNIACDIYKEIAIKSVTEKYMTFYFMKARYQVDWTATACHIYYENQTVYKDRYDATLKRHVKEPVTEKVQRVNRVPQSGTHIFNSEELVLASESLGKHFSVETDTAKLALLAAFETQQDSKYSTYDTQRINPRDIQKEDGRFIYKGLVLDAQIDKHIYADRKKRMADTASERAAPEITNSIGGDYYENLNAIRHTLSESVAYVCIPVQIIEYTYKGKNYAALSDLLSYTSTMPVIYPCDTELATAMERLETQKQSAQKAPGLKVGLVIMGIGMICLLIGMISGLVDIFIPLMLVFNVGGLIVLLVSLIVQHSRKKKFKNSASDIKQTLFDPRVAALEITKKQFFEEYTDYASAQNAAANADCLAIKKTNPELGDAGAIRKKMAFVTNDLDSDDKIIVLEDGIKRTQKRRTISILLSLLIGAGLGILGIIWIGKNYYLHTIVSGIVWAMIVGGFGFAFFGSMIILGNMNSRINKLRAAIAAYKLHKQLSEEFENPQEQPESMSDQLSVWTQERIAETIEQLTKQADKSIPKKQRVRDWIKKHKILLIITSGVVLLVLLALAIESIICSVQAKPYEQGLVGRTFEYQWEFDYFNETIVYTYRFAENNKVEYSRTEINNDTNQITDSSKYVEKYQIHYDIFTGDIILTIDRYPSKVKLTDDGTNISSFKIWSDTYYEVTDKNSNANNTNTSNGGSTSNEELQVPTDMGKTCSICGKTESEVLFAYDTDHICVGCADQNQENDWNNEGSHSGVGADVSFEEALQQSKYWSMEWYDFGALYSACFGFEDSGTCYMLLNAGFEILSTGIGSYTVDGNEVSIDIVLDGESNYSYDFRYDQKTGTFIQTSNSGIAYNHNAGDQFAIETANITVAGKMQEIFSSSLPGGHDDSNDPVATDPPATKPAATEPPATKPTATKPAATEPPATKPAATKPPATEGPTECPHEYSFATCTEPQTCIHCGDTIGEPLGHTYSDATCTAPKTCTLCGQESGSALGHSWTDITETVHHEEQGHYEEQQDAVEVQMYRCPMCGYNQPNHATLDEYYAHFDSEHGDDPTSGFLREAYELVYDWVYETVTVWVVDQEEYTETVVLGQECEVCGEIEEY